MQLWDCWAHLNKPCSINVELRSLWWMISMSYSYYNVIGSASETVNQWWAYQQLYHLVITCVYYFNWHTLPLRQICPIKFQSFIHRRCHLEILRMLMIYGYTKFHPALMVHYLFSYDLKLNSDFTRSKCCFFPILINR
jgi:hypothetical protein